MVKAILTMLGLTIAIGFGVVCVVYLWQQADQWGRNMMAGIGVFAAVLMTLLISAGVKENVE